MCGKVNSACLILTREAASQIAQSGFVQNWSQNQAHQNRRP